MQFCKNTPTSYQTRENEHDYVLRISLLQQPIEYNEMINNGDMKIQDVKMKTS